MDLLDGLIIEILRFSISFFSRILTNLLEEEKD